MTPLNVVDLNFEGIRSSLKTWMAANPTFTDYDFEASGLSFLIDVLAYNTTYNAVLANFMANEMFLDTAVKRSSVVSHAKALGYHPRSYRAAHARVRLVIDTLTLGPGKSAPDTFVLRRGTAFTSSVDNSYYEFVTVKDYSALKATDNKYYFDNIELVEGILNTYAWQVTTTDFNVMYGIPNSRVDTSTINMQVYPGTTSIAGTSWFHTSSLFNATETSNIFFTQESFGEKVEFYFGNGVVGNKPALGNVIRIEYVSTNGASANGARSFSQSRGILHNGDNDISSNAHTIEMLQKAEQGSDAESIDEIKYYASKHFTVQNRAVTPFDYVSIIRENFFNVEAIKVWGGEDNLPAHYNTVFICIKPIYGEYLTETEKTTIKNIIADRAIMNMGVIFTNPDYINVIVESTIYFTPSKLKIGNDLSAIIRGALLYYSDNELEAFNKQFRYSNLMSVIDGADASVNNNNTSVKMYKTIDVERGKPRSYTVSFMNNLSSVAGSIESTPFHTTLSEQSVVLRNSGTFMNLGYYDEKSNFVVLKEMGTINYAAGSIVLNTINIISIQNDVLNMFAKPLTNDIISIQSNILRIKNTDVTLKLVADIPNQLRISAT